MTALTDFFCDYCNPGAVIDDTLSGYARELAPNTPLGWWEVPGKGPDGKPGHACPECVMNDDSVRHDIAQRRGEETRRLVGELDVTPTRDKVILDTDERESDDPTPGWPSRTSPFDG